MIPSESHHRGGIFSNTGSPRHFVHSGGSAQKLIDGKALQSEGHETNRTAFTGATTDPIPHRETRNPTFRLSCSVQLTTLSCHRDKMRLEIEASGFKGRFRDELSVASLLGTTRFRYDHN
jgi:hypothetical protein